MVRPLRFGLLLGIAGVALIAGCSVLNSPPTADFSVFPGSGTAPLSVIFDGTSSSDSDGYIATYKWESGDGGTLTGSDAMAQHTYETAGTFVARLTVTDDAGATATATHTIRVEAASSRLQIIDWQLEPYNNMFMPWVITGHARNVSGRTLSYAEVDGQFYDQQNVLLASSFDNTANLPAGVTWEFNIYLFSLDVADRVHHARIEVGSCMY